MQKSNFNGFLTKIMAKPLDEIWWNLKRIFNADFCYLFFVKVSYKFNKNWDFAFNSELTLFLFQQVYSISKKSWKNFFSKKNQKFRKIIKLLIILAAMMFGTKKVTKIGQNTAKPCIYHFCLIFTAAFSTRIVVLLSFEALWQYLRLRI